MNSSKWVREYPPVYQQLLNERDEGRGNVKEEGKER